MEELRVRGVMPRRQYRDDAGADLVIAPGTETVILGPGECHMFDTGTAIDLPEGFTGLVFSRSGMGSRGIRVRNGVGVIDSSYKSNIKAMIENVSDEPIWLQAWDRIAQLVIVPIVTPRFFRDPNDDWPKEERGGFGSTGVA